MKTNPNSEYKEFIKRWELVDDVVRSRVKDKGRRERYLPRPNPDDTSRRNKLLYDNYVQRALFYNFTKPTMNTAIGSMFNKKPKVELSQNIEFMLDNVDGSGFSLNQQKKKAGEMLLKFSRAGLFVDWTDPDSNLTRSQEQERGARPVILLQNPKNIIDWKTAVLRNRRVLSKVVLREDIDAIDDEGEWSKERRLILDDAGLYSVEVKVFKDDEEQPEFGESYQPMASGRRLDYIPFYFLGGNTNDETIDDALLFDMAEINVAHFQSSADYEDFRYKLGQVQPVLTGLTQDEISENGGKLAFGSGVAWAFGKDANAQLLQAEPNTASMESMNHKESQARAIGAKILEAGGAQKTATEAEILLGSETASISTIVDNIEDGYRSAFEAVIDFSGSGEAEIELSRDFATAKLSPQELQQLMDGVFKGLIPDSVLFARMRKAGLVQEGVTDEELRDQLDNSTLGLGLNGAE